MKGTDEVSEDQLVLNMMPRLEIVFVPLDARLDR